MDAKLKQQWSKVQSCLDAKVGMQSQEQHSRRAGVIHHHARGKDRPVL